jgi:tRNA A-37 threonylcarbamoyl transferase component Bud32
MQDVFNHLHENQVSHGDLYAHNILFDQQANIIFGDFGAATMHHMLIDLQQVKIKQIEQRALSYLIHDLLGVCVEYDQNSEPYNDLQQYAASLR